MPDIVTVKFKPKNKESAEVLSAVVPAIKTALEQMARMQGQKFMIDVANSGDCSCVNMELEGAAKVFRLDEGRTSDDVETAWKAFQDLKAEMKDVCNIEYSVVSTDNLGLQA